ncbi:MAG: PA14 domain-containing protein [Sideroxyarcus sp.]
MSEFPTQYRVLLDQRHWDEAASFAGLEARADGALLLPGLPCFAAGGTIRLSASYDDATSSGVACVTTLTTYTTVTAEAGQIIVAECGCCEYEVISSPAYGDPTDTFKYPRGLLAVGDQLLVADSGNARVLVLELPSLRKRTEWTSGLEKPACLASDSIGRVYVLDIGNKILRFNADSVPDASFSVSVSAPASIAVDAQDMLYVADASADAVLCIDTKSASGTSTTLTLPASSFKPRTLAARGTRLYVADAESGSIWAYDILTRVWLGKVQAYCGPVAALAIDGSGALLVKPGEDDTLYKLDADVARVESGTLLAGPLDAGEGDIWERVWIEAEIPAETSVLLEVAASNGTTPPNSSDWKLSPSHDVLLRTLLDGDGARFIWLRITLASLDGRATPQLLQVQASTAQPSYMDYLPGIYRRDDMATGFLERWLALFRAEQGDWDRALEELPRQFDARTVDEADLGKLAAWLALDLPMRMDAPEQRQLLVDAQALYRQRGTPAGLREMVRRYLGATIHIFESFRERCVWQLGEGMGLGLGTALAAGTPDGVIVPGYAFADPLLAGLRGDYYEGTKFEVLRYSRVDKKVKFNWVDKSPLADVPSQQSFPANNFSVRWSGQVRPRYSDTYMFSTLSDDGVRLWVGGKKIIDNWTDHAATTNIGHVILEAGRWYPIVLEFYEKGGLAQIELSWWSMSQRQEIVPQECLYSLRDEAAEFAPQAQSGNELLEVGHAIVGESRPQEAEDFGAPLADDYAHLFSVFVPAAQVPLAAQRQALRDLIEAEKPAYTDFQLCLVEPRMRVGVQARLGIDSIVAGPGPAMQLGIGELGNASYLGGGLSPSETSMSMETAAG